MLCCSFFTATTSPVLSCSGSYLHISTLPKFPCNEVEHQNPAEHLLFSLG